MKKTFILAIAILSTALFMSCESSDVKEARQKVSEFVKAEKEKGLAQSPDRTGKFEDLVLKGGKLIFTNSYEFDGFNPNVAKKKADLQDALLCNMICDYDESVFESLIAGDVEVRKIYKFQNGDTVLCILPPEYLKTEYEKFKTLSPLDQSKRLLKSGIYGASLFTPIQMDENTLLTKIKFEDDKTVTFTYNVIENDEQNLNTMGKDKFAKAMHDKNIAEFTDRLTHGSNDVIRLITNCDKLGYTIRRVYRGDITGEKISFDITPEEVHAIAQAAQ